MLVLGQHSRDAVGFPPNLNSLFYWLFDGGLGVRFFFVISGFLITWLLIRESDLTGRISLSYFYARRALRILPVYAAFLLILFTLQCYTPWMQSSAAWVSNLTFTTNFLSLDERSKASLPLWSLAVEEQFYLLWPGLLLGFGLAMNFRRAAFILVIPILLAPIFRVITNLVQGGVSSQSSGLSILVEWMMEESPSAAIFRSIFSTTSFLNYFDSLAIGALCAFLLARRGEKLIFYAEKIPKAICVIALLLIIVPHVLSHLQIVKWLTGTVGPSMQAVGFATLLVQSVLSPKFGIYRALNWRWVSQIGVLSYSIYIWNTIFYATPDEFGFGQVWWVSFPWWLIPSFAVAAFSYYALEKPLLRYRAQFRPAK